MGLLTPGEVWVAVRTRGTTDADDREQLHGLASRASGVSSLTLSRRCSHCGGDDHGAPSVDVLGLFVSLSRASDTVAFAVSHAPVGIDIESVRAVARRDLDPVAFTAAERARLASASQPDLLRSQLWAGKEAVAKLRGTGLRLDPSSFELADACEQLQPFDAGPGLVGVVAGVGHLAQVE